MAHGSVSDGTARLAEEAFAYFAVVASHPSWRSYVIEAGLICDGPVSG